MSNITPFDFDGRAIRVVTDDSGEPWFSANEVCEVLGYSNPRDAVGRHVDVDDVGKRDTIDSMGRSQAVNHVNESGLYALIFGSTKPEAKRFKRWVTSDVLPTIRKTGSYTTKKPQDPLRMATEAAKAFPALQRVARLLGLDKNAAAISANQAIYSMTQVDLLQRLGHTHLAAENQDSRWYTPTEIGRIIGQSNRVVNLMLVDAGLQTKDSGQWEPTDAGKRYARIFDTGKKHLGGTSVTQLKWSNDVIQILRGPNEIAA